MKLELADISTVEPGQSAEVVAGGKIFAVFNVDGRFHVLDGLCAHAGGPLGKGTLDGTTVTCPWHGWQFDVESGRHQLSEHVCQKRYDCEVVDGKIIVELPDAA